MGRVVLDGDLGPDPMTGIQWPPFRSFGEGYYTYQLLLDLKVGDDMAVRTEPHPRYYTSPDDDVPLAVPALLRTSWWPMISFVIFKAPPEGRVHIFRPGEPFMQILFLPAEPHFELTPMSEEEAAERELRSRRIHASRDTLGKDSTWTSSTNTVFDGTYRLHSRRRPRQGPRRRGRRILAAEANCPELRLAKVAQSACLRLIAKAQGLGDCGRCQGFVLNAGTRRQLRISIPLGFYDF